MRAWGYHEIGTDGTRRSSGYPAPGIMLNARCVMFNQIKGLHYVKRAMRYVKCRIARCAPGTRGHAAPGIQRIALCQSSESPCAARSPAIDSTGKDQHVTFYVLLTRGLGSHCAHFSPTESALTGRPPKGSLPGSYCETCTNCTNAQCVTCITA